MKKTEVMTLVLCLYVPFSQKLLEQFSPFFLSFSDINWLEFQHSIKKNMHYNFSSDRLEAQKYSFGKTNIETYRMLGAGKLSIKMSIIWKQTF